MDNETRSLPMVALRGLTIMPEMIVHFDVSRERSIAAIQQAMVEEQEIFLVAQKSIERTVRFLRKLKRQILIFVQK